MPVRFLAVFQNILSFVRVSNPASKQPNNAEFLVNPKPTKTFKKRENKMETPLAESDLRQKPT